MRVVLASVLVQLGSLDLRIADCRSFEIASQTRAEQGESLFSQKSSAA
jgi:hypothetical protein